MIVSLSAKHYVSNNKAIGIFDSGVGGLTVMRQIHALLPHENICYFGDTARVPYGNKSPETIKKYARENADFLQDQNIKLYFHKAKRNGICRRTHSYSSSSYSYS